MGHSELRAEGSQGLRAYDIREDERAPLFLPFPQIYPPYIQADQLVTELLSNPHSTLRELVNSLKNWCRRASLVE